ncbi:MAG: hypothetical protein Q7T11_01380 [Deltaproteobacteria bacterium]|nr:hypothetical protein [Deltaproteobacteria bacterium]
MKRLLSRAGVRTKTEYVNMALQEYNRKLSRELDLEKTSVIPAKAGIHHSFPR